MVRKIKEIGHITMTMRQNYINYSYNLFTKYLQVKIKTSL